MARSNKAIFFLLAACICLLGECSTPNNNGDSCRTKHDVYLGVTNSSFIDTLAFAKVYIDDSLTFSKQLRLRRLTTTDFQKILHLCEGPHRVKAHFGRYSKDTTITINSKTSLIIDMDYETAYPGNNGLVIVKLERDGDPKGNAPD